MQIDLSWEALLSLGTVSSLIDIVIVSFIIYQLIKIVRGTRINEYFYCSIGEGDQFCF